MTFTDCIKSIDQEYVALNHRLGWRFLTCTRERFSPASEVLLLSLHPGGHSEDPEHPRASSEGGSAYLVESWHGHEPGCAPLQLQVQLLAEALGLELGSLLSAYFIPFRAPDTASLCRFDESMDFATRLWEGAMETLSPNLVICLGKETERRFRGVIGSPLSEKAYGVGWDPQTAVVGQYRDKVVLTLPHLSRFKLLGRPKSSAPLQVLFSSVASLRAELTGAGH